MNAPMIEVVPSSLLLAGVEVLELSSSVAGAYAGRLLAAMGARVRRMGPPLELGASADALPLVEAWLHQGKEETPLRVAPPLAELTAGTQLIIAERDSVDAEFATFVETVNSYASALHHAPVIVGVRRGALAENTLAANALTSSAWSGMSWSMGDADKVPLSLPFDLADYQAAIQACAAGLVGVLADPAQQSLRSVDVAGRDVLAYYTGMITTNFIPYERPWCRDGARPPGSAGVYPASIFACRDGHVVFMCRSQREWDILLEAMGSPEWSKDPRFSDPRVVARLYADEADQYLVPWIAGKTKQELMDFGRRHGLPVAPVRTVAQALDDPQFEHRHFLTDQPTDGKSIRVPSQPWKLRQLDAVGDSESSRTRCWPVDGARTSNATEMFTGLRVLDLSWVWSGPLTTSILADLGADVIKVEHSDHLDTGRMRGKARRNGVEVDGPEYEATPYFNQMNHGKRSITVDLKHPRAREILLDLVEHCDIVVENMRPGVLDRLGIGYEQFAARNPAVVMLSMSMAGQTGPLSDMKGYAGIMAAMSGLESLIGYDEDHLVGSLAPALGDPNAAGHAMCVLLASLYRRRETGRGVWIDLSQIEALLSVLGAPVIESQLPDGVAVPVNRHPHFAPHGHFQCAGFDEWVAIAIRTDQEWNSLVELAAGSPLAAREEWRDGPKRLVARQEVEAALEQWTSEHDRDALVAALLGRGIAAAPVCSFEDLVASEWKRDRRLTVDVAHPYLGETEVFTVPWRFGGQNPGVALPAPLLGADTEPVLRKLLTMSPEEIKKLQDDSVLR
ncbi:CaiB/BaiF CoA-transferase family protein [Nocardia rhamnosiphila]|uniref:CoA transferase n=1 Tax=Nocardia rhamnosiphila TaxID=426716 RepID=A0ABV2X0W4_9NOCA